MAYNRTTWQDSPSTSTPINAANLNNIETGLTTVDTAVTNLVTQPFGTVNVNYTLETADSGKLIKLTSSTAIVVTLPASGSVNFPIGQRVDFIQTGTGTVTFGTASSGTAGTVTILSTPSLILRTRYSGATVIKTNTNEWVVVGDMY